MGSLQIAELTGKRHDAILRDIRNLLEHGVQAHNFVESRYEQILPTGGKKQVPCYDLTGTGVLILASGYNAVLREKIINRWMELEMENKPKTSPDVRRGIATCRRTAGTDRGTAETASRAGADNRRSEHGNRGTASAHKLSRSDSREQIHRDHHSDSAGLRHERKEVQC